MSLLNVYNICYFFLCIRCKLTLQVHSKHIKIIKKKKKAQTKLVNLKKKGRRQVTKPKILFITLFMSLFTLFIYRKKEHKSMTEKKIKKKSDEQSILNKPKVL